MKVSLTVTAFVLLGMASSAAASDAPRLALSFKGEPPTVHAYGDLKRGWTLTVKAAFALKNLESDDQLTATLKRGRKQVAKLTCRRRTGATFYGDLTDATKDTATNVFECRSSKRQKRTGTFSVTFDYTSTDADKTFKRVALLRFKVTKGKRYYYANQDNLVGPVFFSYDPRSMRSKFDSRQPKLWFYTHVMLPYTRSTPKNIKIRCKKDGKKIFQKDLRADSKISISDQFSMYKIVVWGTHHIREGSLLNKNNIRTWPFGDNPGAYDCKISIEGKSYRRFKFTVKPDGLIEDSCGPALGMDVAHGIFTNNKSAHDHKHNKKAAGRQLLWLPKLPRQCRGLL